MAIINPYLNFEGTTEAAFNFYKSVFGGEFLMIQRFKDTPEADRVPEAEKNMLMHVSLPIGKHNVLMGTDALESMGHKITPGTNFSIAIGTETKEEADRLYKGLAAGGKESMPMTQTFWGAYFGMLTDKFGVQWMVSYDANVNAK
jgi:PhnB protein